MSKLIAKVDANLVYDEREVGELGVGNGGWPVKKVARAEWDFEVAAYEEGREPGAGVAFVSPGQIVDTEGHGYQCPIMAGLAAKLKLACRPILIVIPLAISCLSKFEQHHTVSHEPRAAFFKMSWNLMKFRKNDVFQLVPEQNEEHPLDGQEIDRWRRPGISNGGFEPSFGNDGRLNAIDLHGL
ncbi:hypothetical protein Ancab_026648 [Ancistrocladus abbreviatus]